MKQLKWGVCLFLFLTSITQGYAYDYTPVKTGAENTEAYLPLLQGKRVGVMANHSSLIGQTHLIDSLVSLGIDVRMIFAPEHGFRGTADAGQTIDNQIDEKTGIPVLSVYGSTLCPPDSVMQQLDVTVFDIQDVGLRFYTYLSSLYYLMEACARNQVPLVVLDRPNPNGHMVSGPILDMKYQSFVGVIPVPVVHGMTLGELAIMINRRHWLPDSLQALVQVAPCLHYTHHTPYSLPVKPSPNLPNNRAIWLYPALCPFEATCVSVGRGTSSPFQVYGHPKMTASDFSFTPESMPGATQPPHKGTLCYGVDLRTLPPDNVVRSQGFTLTYVVDAFQQLRAAGLPESDFFLSNFFEKLVGVAYIRPMILEGKSASQIEAVWAQELDQFKKERLTYLLYPL